MTALLHRWLTRLRSPHRADAEEAFLALAGAAAPIAWLEWLPGLAVVGVVLVLLWFLPTGWLPLEWFGTWPGVWLAAASWILLATGVELVRACRSADRLAAAYAAADAKLGHTFLRSPGSLAGAACLLLATRLPGLDSMGWLAAVLAGQAAAELAVRCLLARTHRLRQAARVVGRGLWSRATAWLVVVAGAVWLLPPPAPEPPSPEQLASQWRADPGVAAADAALRQAFAAAGSDDAAPADLLRLRGDWDSTHVTDGGIAASLRADALVLDRLHAFQAFWTEERTHPYGPEDLAGRCATAPPEPACRVRNAAAPVPGSDGALLYRVARRGDLPGGTQAGDWLTPDLLDVFEAAGEGGWRHVLRVAYDPGPVPRLPRLVASPVGDMLVLPPANRWSIPIGEVPGGDQVFRREGGAWRRIDTTSWLKQAASALPRHQCLLQTAYASDGVPLATELEPDYGSLSLLGRYGRRTNDIDGASGLVRFTFGIRDGALFVRGTALSPLPETRPWWRRWLSQGADC